METFEGAVQLIEKKEYEYAILLLSNCIKSDFKKLESLYNRANCLINIHQYKYAIKDLKEIVKIDQFNYEAYIKQADCYVAIGDIYNAITTLQMFKQNKNIKIQIEVLKEIQKEDGIARKLFIEDKYEKALEIMNNCLKKYETCLNFKLLKAKCLVHLNKHNEAMELINNILAINNDNPEAKCINAMSLLYQEKYALGLKELKNILSTSTSAIHLYNEYKAVTEILKQGITEYKKNNYSYAKQLLKEVLILDRRNKNLQKRILSILADIYLKEKDYKNCIETACNILKIDETNTKALEFRAKCNVELEDFDLAIEDYKMILSIEKHNTNIEKKLQMAQNKMIINDKDYYKILGLSSKNVTIAKIKKAFHTLAKLYHPDKAELNSEYYSRKLNIKFAKINKAYQELLKIHQ